MRDESEAGPLATETCETQRAAQGNAGRGGAGTHSEKQASLSMVMAVAVFAHAIIPSERKKYRRCHFGEASAEPRLSFSRKPELAGIAAYPNERVDIGLHCCDIVKRRRLQGRPQLRGAWSLHAPTGVTH